MGIQTKPQKSILYLIILGLIFLTGLTGWLLYDYFKPFSSSKFDGGRAYKDVVYQVNLGPRTVGSQSHVQVVDWMVNRLKKTHWDVEVQKTAFDNVPIQNIIAKRGSGSPWVILGAHYDSRSHADNDPNLALQNQPVPGANDGASGVAVLLELARVLPGNITGSIWLVFLDAEDDGKADGTGWILGAEAFVKTLTDASNNRLPDDAIIIDMIGDANLDIYKEYNSTPQLTDSIWAQAAKLGYNQFIPMYKYRMEDDHLPFLEAKIPAVDIIDFDYQYWHTTQDTADKVSAESMQVIGDTLFAWLMNNGWKK